MSMDPLLLDHFRMPPYRKRWWNRIRSWFLEHLPQTPHVATSTHFELLLPKSRNAATLTHLELLPNELIHEIKSWLPPSSAVSLALCSGKLLEVIGMKPFLDLKIHESERALFLQTLDFDLPETLYCFTCNRLHVLFQRCRTKIYTNEMFQRVAKKQCPFGDGVYNIGTAFIYSADFKFEHLQMAAKLHRRGDLPEANAYMARLSLTEPAAEPMTLNPEYNGLYLFEPRFVNNRIYARAQSWLWFPGGQTLVMPRVHCTMVCAHMNAQTEYYNPYKAAFNCKLDHLSKGEHDCEKCRSPMWCAFCPTDVTLELKWCLENPRGGFLVTTKWQTLGHGITEQSRGLGMSPMGCYWRSHLDGTGTCWPYTDRRGFIRDDFEAQATVKYDSLLSVDKARSILCSQGLTDSMLGLPRFGFLTSIPTFRSWTD